MLIDVMARTVLLDWKGFENEGEDVPYSVTNAIDMLTKYKEFRNFVAKNADNMQAYKRQDSEENRGNLPTESDGSLSGQTKNDS